MAGMKLTYSLFIRHTKSTIGMTTRGCLGNPVATLQIKFRHVPFAELKFDSSENPPTAELYFDLRMARDTTEERR